MFVGRKNTKPFITYVGGSESDRKEVKVPVNGKLKPFDDDVKYPPQMDHFKKTTMVRYTDDSTWHVVTTRVAASQILRMGDLSREVEKLCVFLQEPRLDHDKIAFYAGRVFDAELDQDHIATMGYKQRKHVNVGIQEVNGCHIRGIESQLQTA